MYAGVGHGVHAPRQRALVAARRMGRRWESEPVPFAGDERAVLTRDEASWRLEEAGSRWDAEHVRVVEKAQGWTGGAALREVIDGAPGGFVVDGARRAPLPAVVDVAVGGTTRVRVAAALCRTFAEGARVLGAPAAFEAVELTCRWPTDRAVLRLSGPDRVVSRAFASVTDMATGREAPAAALRGGGAVVFELAPCRGLTRLRIYWPLE
jgi:hypothetical protein